jgi:hypothetical protein
MSANRSGGTWSGRGGLILRYQRRAHWRRLIRIRDRTLFYLLALAVLTWFFIGLLPVRLSQAARELSAGQTVSMEGVRKSIPTFDIKSQFDHPRLQQNRPQTVPKRKT